MSYLEAIKIAFLTFPFLAFLFTIPFIIRQYHKYGSINKLRVLIIYSFILYIICVYFLAIFPLPDRDSIDMSSPVCQLVPFNFISDIIKETVSFDSVWQVLSDSSVYTVLFNILMFIPFGMYLRYYFKNNLKKTILFSFLFSLFLEITQLTGLYFIYPHPYRLFDVDDLMINTLGGITGYFVMGLFIKFLPSRDEIDISSIEAGKKVSGLRRFTRFCLDMFLCFIFTIILYAIFRVKHVLIISLFIYYVFIPSLRNGQTLGSKYLKMRIDVPNKRFLRLFFRLFLMILYYLVIPFGIGYLMIFITRNVNISSILVFVIMAIYVLLLGIFYLVNMTNIFKRRVLIYDRLARCEYVSTIGKDIEDNFQSVEENIDES